MPTPPTGKRKRPVMAQKPALSLYVNQGETDDNRHQTNTRN